MIEVVNYMVKIEKKRFGTPIYKGVNISKSIILDIGYNNRVF